MDQKEYEALLARIERMIESSVRGYRPGVHFRILGLRGVPDLPVMEGGGEDPSLFLDRHPR